MITIGFSSHHVEALPFARVEMDGHGVVVLEEPPSPLLPAMLQGDIPVDDYIAELDAAFPEYQKRMCGIVQELHRSGVRIVQVEPYLETFRRIEELFAAGETPGVVMQTPELREVYMAERDATGALLDYYSSTVNDSFESIVEALKRFAGADARRLALRARLRAEAIVPLAGCGESVYIEAGYIHFPLYIHLRNELGGNAGLRVVYLLDPALRKLNGKRRALGPGDILTLGYIFNNGLRQGQLNLLAARSLIYVKLIQKKELLPGASAFPHTEDGVKVNDLVNRLEFHQCRELFERIHALGRNESVEVVQRYVEQMP